MVSLITGNREELLLKEPFGIWWLDEACYGGR
jgi:hypothetical protein